jgi:two-component system CheB/CheR fusion protein
MTKKEEATGKEEIQISEEEKLRSAEETSINGGQPAPGADSNESPEEDFPVVGIGASAGGLAAFEAFFSAMPPEPGMAFVMVQHLDPNHKSILTDLIGRYTRMSVYEVRNEMAVRPNCVYVIPPNRDMVFQGDTLLLLEPTEPRGHRLPIDSFFKSLAGSKQEWAVGIVLSGTGSDGTKGVRAIKARGGMVMAQTPESSEYDSMPLSAISTGLVDYILTPAEMPAQLIDYITGTFEKMPQVPSKAKDPMKKIFDLLRIRTGHDFSYYKHNTINRRIERRIAAQNLKSRDDYLRYLEQNPAEVEALFRAILIGVTSFFRNPEAFETLQEKVISRLFVDRPLNSVIRIWVPGCSTGEEAYSIGILLREQMEKLNQIFKVQIFATDIDTRAVVHARGGVFPASISNDISSERLDRFFTRDSDGNYRIQHIIREMITFSDQNVIRDPPFSKLDLISCRNLLIYMDKELQKKLIPLFHYALNPGGFLFLGPSETVGEFTNLFDTVDRTSKIYKKKGGAASDYLLSTRAFFLPRLESRAQRTSGTSPVEIKPQLRDLTERVMLQHYAPVSVLVNERGDILYIHGRTGLYLEPTPGEAGMNILKMAREGLQQELTSALHKAVMSKEPVFRSGLRVKTNGDFSTVGLALRPVEPVQRAAGGPDLFLVTFEKPLVLEQAQTGKVAGIDAGEGACESTMGVDERILKLKQELQAKEERLKAYSEELETSNEELKSSNEEMQSVNEELQSTNEELETSKEELQSVNEELATVNTELQDRVAELSQANNDMNNLLSGTGIGTIFVDHQLRILRFTPPATQFINLIPSDVGRPVGHLVSNFLGYDRLVEDIKDVLDSLIPKDFEVQTREGAWYLLNIRPYRTLENFIEGAVITFTDITETKRAKLKESGTMRRLAAVVQDARDAITMRDMEGHILAWNTKAEKIYGWSEDEAIAMNIRNLVPESREQEELATLKKLSQAETPEPYRSQRIAKDGRIVDIWLTVTPLVNEAGEVYAIATTEREIKSENTGEKDRE